MTKGQKNIVILGAGFAGVRTALELTSHRWLLRQYRVILIDRNTYHLFTPWLYERATSGSPARGLKIPLRAIFASRDIELLRGEVQSIDRHRHNVTLGSGQTITYDYLVMALGSVSNDFGVPGVSKYALTLKSYEDAEGIRKAVKSAYRKFLQSKSSGELLQIVIGGGGFTGVELAGELYEYLKGLAAGYNDDDRRFAIRILDADTRLLQGLSPWVSMIAQQRLGELPNMRIELQSRITVVKKRTLKTAAGDEYEHDLLIWTAGVKPNPLASICQLARDGRAKTKMTLQTPDDPHTFAIGDVAVCRNPRSHRETVQTIYNAYTQGELAAENILRHIRGESLLPYHAHNPGYVVPIRGDWAVSTVLGYAVTGKSAYWLLRIVHLRYFLSILPLTQALARWYRRS